MGKIYIPITGSPESRKAVVKAVELAKQFKMKLVAISVINRELLTKLERYKIFIEEESSLFTDSMRKTTEKHLQYAQKTAETEGIEMESVLLEGDPYTEIVEYLHRDKEASKLICIAKKSGGEYMKDIFSSVERKILLFGDFNIIVIGEGL